MRTNFAPAQLSDPHLADAERNLRACVHCGICTATCPTYILTGDERDGPRGRIVMMQNMLEADTAPSRETVHHLDRCLSCLGCRTSCPSGVNYPRLIDTARNHIEAHYRRPVGERALRWLIAQVLTRPVLARAMLQISKFAAPLAFLLPGRLRIMAQNGAAMSLGQSTPVAATTSHGAKRIALMPGCVQQSLAPQIDEAVARLLTHRRYALVPLEGAGCCGSLVHHLGREDDAKAWAKRAIAAFERDGECEAVLITATGCSSHLKDLAQIFSGDPEWQPRAARFAAKVKDFSELVSPRSTENPAPLRVAYHAPCSQQHGLRINGVNEMLLTAAGFEVLAIPEGHLCCGSAGSYSILQPGLADQLRDRKLANIATLKPDVIATANIGCLEHLSGEWPIVHVAELLDWAEGGPVPQAFHHIARK